VETAADLRFLLLGAAEAVSIALQHHLTGLLLSRHVGAKATRPGPLLRAASPGREQVRSHGRDLPGKPAAWARVICSVAIHYRGSIPDGATTVVLGVELIGGEIADTRFRIRCRVRAEDPIDLAAPLSYSVEVLADDDDPEDLDPEAAALSKSASGS